MLKFALISHQHVLVNVIGWWEMMAQRAKCFKSDD